MIRNRKNEHHHVQYIIDLYKYKFVSFIVCKKTHGALVIERYRDDIDDVVQLKKYADNDGLQQHSPIIDIARAWLLE